MRRGILGGLSGKVGNLVGTSWKGIAVIKSLPLSVANPNTAGQVTQRTKMSNVVEFAKLILATIIKPLNDRFASGQSGFNLFVQRNIDFFLNAFAVGSQSNVILSQGNVATQPMVSIDPDVSDGNIGIVWTDTSGYNNALGTDQIFIVATNSSRSSLVAVGLDDGFDRDNLPATIDLPEGTQAGDAIYLYVSMRRLDGSQVSNTTTINALAVA